MRRGRLHLSGWVYLVLVIAMIVSFFSIEAIISSNSARTKAEIARITTENAALEEELQRLQDELAFIKTDAGIELYARAQGMSMPGETRYNPINP